MQPADHAGPEEIAAAVAILRQGGLVAFPTETVYGLGADCWNQRAIERVFALKGRPASNPLIVHVSGPAMARSVVSRWPVEAESLAEAFWPGPLSLVLPRAEGLPAIVTAGGPTVAVRCPDHLLTLSLLEAFGAPLVGPSANPSGAVSPTTAQHVRESFSPEQVYVLEGGPCRTGIESTVLSLAGGQARILRRGVLGPDAIGAVLGRRVEDAGPGEGHEDGALPSPGLLPSHYAPRSPMVLIDGAGAPAQPEGTVVVGFEAVPGRTTIVMPAGARDYAARLYSALRQADAGAPRLIAVVRPQEAGSEEERAVWRAVLDRLARATA